MTIIQLNLAYINSKFNNEISKPVQNFFDQKITRIMLAALICIAAAFGLYRLWQWYAKKITSPTPQDESQQKTTTSNPTPQTTGNQDNAPSTILNANNPEAENPTQEPDSPLPDEDSGSSIIETNLVSETDPKTQLPNVDDVDDQPQEASEETRNETIKQLSQFISKDIAGIAEQYLQKKDKKIDEEINAALNEYNNDLNPPLEHNEEEVQQPPAIPKDDAVVPQPQTETPPAQPVQLAAPIIPLQPVRPIQPIDPAALATLIPIQFITKVVPKDATNNDLQPLNIEIHDTGKTRASQNGEEYPEYELRNADTQKRIGTIALKPTDDHIEISHMSSESKWNRALPYKNIGRALHEFAIRKSFQLGLGGKVRLKPTFESDLFHFKCGFRYIDSSWSSLPHQTYSWIENLYCQYQHTKQRNAPTKEILELITIAFEKYPKALKRIKKVAEQELGKTTDNLEELMKNGLFLNRNTIYERVFYHPEDTRTYGFNVNQPHAFACGDHMELGDEEIAKWKAIIEAEKGPEKY